MNQQQISAAHEIFQKIDAERERLKTLALVRTNAREIHVAIRGTDRGQMLQLFSVTYLAKHESGALGDPALLVLDIETDAAKARLRAHGRELAQLGLPKPDDCR